MKSALMVIGLAGASLIILTGPICTAPNHLIYSVVSKALAKCGESAENTEGIERWCGREDSAKVIPPDEADGYAAPFAVRQPDPKIVLEKPAETPTRLKP